jgi:hypothetical protein
MNIRNIDLGSKRAEAYRTNQVADTARSGAGGGTQQANEIKSAIRDKVEISDAARAALSNDTGPREIDFAKKALLGIPPLSEKRAADIMARVQNGYYSQPDVLRQTAERLGSELSTRLPE